jgi:SDR family mycofactocin-dependent oxidoreductase
MGRLDGKIAFITGAGRGQGRSHAVHFAREGADVILVDICEDISGVDSPMSSDEDLAETVRQVEALDRRVVWAKADVRDLDRLREVVDSGVAELGGLDILVANAGVGTMQAWDDVTPEVWDATVDVCLKGTWHACAVSAPHLIERGGGVMILTSSSAGILGAPFLVPYTAAKHGVVGLMKALANELGIHNIRVNAVLPAAVDTPMRDVFTREATQALVASRPDVLGIFSNAMPEPETLEAVDISNAMLFLASDEGRYVTGLQMTVDLGNVVH